MPNHDDNDDPHINGADQTVLGRITSRARIAIAKRQSELAYRNFQVVDGPQAEYHTASLYSETRLVPLDKIVPDPDFENFRQRIDPVKLADLQTSVELEGLRTPVTLIEASSPGGLRPSFFHVRAGFRRVKAVRNLGWQKIPAIVLPADMPRSEEYWVNILENTNRDKLGTYELACAARKMRDEFRVSGHDFARKTGHSPDYVYKLLACLDRLPPEVVHSWQRGDRVPFSIYFDLSCMSPVEAIRNLRLWMGQRRIERVSDAGAERQAAESLRRLQVRRKSSEKLWTVRGVERTQRLLMAVKVSGLKEETKEICVKVIEYCLGCRRRIDGIVDDHRRVPTQDFVPPANEDLDLETLDPKNIETEVAGGLEPPANRELDEMRDKIEREHKEDPK